MMIDLRDLAPHGVTIEELRLPPGLAIERRIEQRHEALRAFDPLVRRALSAAGAGLPAATIDLTLYDAVYPANPLAGGHWTVAALRLGMLSHSVWSYTVTLLFDGDDQPTGFAVHAAADTVSAGTSEPALRDAIERAGRGGPQRSFAMHVFPSLGL